MDKTIEVSRETISSGFLQLDNITYKRGEKEFKREVVNRGDAVAGLLFNTATQKYVFVKQFRPGVGDEIIEIIAGTMDVNGESPEECFIREIEEETGYRVTSDCNLICSCYSSPGSLTEKVHIFIAETNNNKSGSGGGVGDEGIEIVEFSKGEILENIEVLSKDSKTFIALLHHFSEDLSI
jgi:nudix-type nucleoside diphosphatase (YffH/AdpP family)